MKFRHTQSGIQADAGFLIADCDIAHIVYSAPRLSLTIPVDRLSSGELVVYLARLSSWDNPEDTEDEILTEHDKKRLKMFLKAAYEFAGVKVTFDI